MSLNCLLAKYFIYDIYDNNESAPELLFKKVGDKVEVSKNYPNLYNMSISSSPPYFLSIQLVKERQREEK